MLDDFSQDKLDVIIGKIKFTGLRPWTDGRPL